MVQYLEKYKQNIAIDMRKRGLSYSEIMDRINVPKSTLSFWLKKIKLTEKQVEKLKNKKLEAIKRGREKKINRTLKDIEEIRNHSAKSIKEISKKELWLMGIVLYWRERLLSGNETDLRKGVRFTSSDPYLIKLFLKWLQDIGGIKDSEIRFDIFVDKNKEMSVNKIVGYWRDVTGFPIAKFDHIYYQKNKPTKKIRKIVNKTSTGLLRIRVSSSSMLARQISGWVKGIVRYYWSK